jgi:hypothetical protein
MAALAAFAACGALGATTSARADDPLMGRSPWNFQTQDRAGIAVVIKNVDDGLGTHGLSTIICGGTSGASGQGATGSGASSTANSSCIIVSGSNGTQITNPQDSSGDQSSSSSAKSKTSSAATKNGSIDDVSAILNGNKQGL